MNREKNIDLLRVIACFLVITLHVCSTYLVSNYETLTFNFEISNVISVFTRVSVPIFVMISGRYLISNYSFNNYKEFYKKKLSRVLIPLFIWNFIYIVLRLLTESEITLKALLLDTINAGSSIHLWFFYLLLGLYLLTPLIVTFKNKLSNKEFRNLTIALLFIGFIMELIRMITGFKNIPLYYPVEFIGFYLSGYTFKKYKPKFSTNIFLALFFFLCISSAFLSIYLKSIENIMFMYSHTSLNPPTLLASLSLYIFFNNIKIKTKLSSISKYTLGIYGIHMIILNIVIYRLFNNFLINSALISIIFFVLIIFISSLFICFILYKIKSLRKFIS